MALAYEQAKSIDLFINSVRQDNANLLSVGIYCNSRPHTAQFELLATGNNPNSLIQGSNPRFPTDLIQVDIDGKNVHTGILVSKSFRKTPQGESVIYQSRSEPYLFGVPAQTHKYLFQDESLASIDRTACLNPMVEGKVVSNFVNYNDPNFGPTGAIVSDGYAFNTNDPTVLPWTLFRAMRYFFLRFRDGEYGDTDLAQWEAALSDDPSLIQDVKIRIGAYLPEVFDSLLIPLGYMWSASPDRRSIQVFPRFDKVGINVQGGQEGLQFNVAAEVVDMDIRHDVSSNSVGRLQVVSSTLKEEATFLLTPAWDRLLEGKPVGHYKVNADEWQDNPRYSDVYRKFVVWHQPNSNVLAPNRYPQVDNINGLLSARQKFQATLTQGDNGSPVGNLEGCFVEISFFEEGEWSEYVEVQTLPDGKTCEVMRDWLGVYFNGDLPMRKILRLGGGNVRIRITATVDVGRVAIEDSNDFGHPVFFTQLGTRPNTLTIDNPGSFPLTGVGSESIFNGLAPNNSTTDQIPSVFERMRQFAALTLLQQRHTGISGVISLRGLNVDYVDKIGYEVGQVNNLDFSLFSGTHRPSLIGCEFDIQNQVTTLQLGDS